MKDREVLRGRREGAGSTEEPCTSENLEESGLKAMEIVGGEERGEKILKRRKKIKWVSVHNFKNERGNNRKWIVASEA